MTNRHLRRRDRSRGQTFVEFALILPVFLLMTLGVVDAARVFSSYIAITNGAREGALYASAGNYTKWCSTSSTVACPTGFTAANQATNPDNIAFRVQQESTGLTQNRIVLLAPTCDSGTCSASSTLVTVRVRYTMTLFVPIVSAILGNPVVLNASTTAVIQ
jgi:Flp pilus assembly protein TadG